MSLHFPSTKCPPNSSSVDGVLKNSTRSEPDSESSTLPQTPNSSLRERVVKELGITSHAFIGPALSSKKTQIAPVKSAIEDQVSEFYKELEKIDATIDVPDTPEKDKAALIQKKTSPYLPTNAELQNTDNYQDNVQHRLPSWPHWYQNEPYSTRRTRPSGDLSSWNMASGPRQWRSFPSKYKTPEPGLYRPQFHQSYLQDVFCGTSPGLSQESHFQEFHSPNIFRENVSRQEYPQHSENDNLGFDQNSNHKNTDWNRYTQHNHFQPVNEWNQKYEFENEWQQSRPPGDSSYTLILMRGLPGSGKSTLARELLSSGPRGVILSTDDYFAHKHGYSYQPCLIGEAHQWNQKRAEDAMQNGCTPIVIDNTNIQAWEMKPYVKMALERGYKVDFCEPETSWKFDSSELERRNKHGVPQEKITQMLSRFSFPISIDIVMCSEEPPHVTR